MYDLLIRNGVIVDGGGNASYPADIAIENGIITEIAPRIAGPARRQVDAKGLVVAPGFIDVHSHDDLVLFEDPWNRPKLLQGVTTVVAGNCGFAPCPATDSYCRSLAEYALPVLGPLAATRAFPDFSVYAAELEQTKKAQNIAALAAHGALRIAESGFDAADPDDRRLERLKRELDAALDGGALGLSLGLMYAPGSYSGPGELQALAGVVAKHGGLVSVHLKSESQFIDSAIADVLALQQASGAAVHISHLKTVGKAFRWRIGVITDTLERRIGRGADVSFDMYPYTFGSTTMSILLPPGMLAEGIAGCLARLKIPEERLALKSQFGVKWQGADNLALHCGWDGITLSSLDGEQNRRWIGKTIAEVAAARGVSPEDACIDLFEEEEGKAAVLIDNMTDEDMRTVLLSQHCLVASDGIPGGVKPHPRLYGAFPRFLRIFVRERQALSVEQAVRKMTSMPARRFGLGKRGLLAPGHIADIVVFDLGLLAERSTVEDPRQSPQGIELVVVGGEIVCERGETTDSMPGRFLRRRARCTAGEM